MVNKVLLSIVIPFFNSHDKSRRLISKLSSINRSDVEFIFIDDGGSPKEHELLREDVKSQLIDCFLIKQDNSGPGAARNAGLKLSRGHYVWFVDSDDDINTEVIQVVYELQDQNYDFIDFHVLKKNEEHLYIDAEYGVNYSNPENQIRLARSFGRIWSKVFSRKFLQRINFVYPENCIYEDNELLFSLPFLALKYYVSNIVSYIHILSPASITRATGFNLRYFDRLYTAEFGIRKSYAMNLSPEVLEILWGKFTSVFLIITVRHLYRSKVSVSWIRYVIARYKRITYSLFDDVQCDLLFDRAMNSLLRLFPDDDEREFFLFLWVNTDTVESEIDFFTRIRNSSWGRDVFRPFYGVSPQLVYGSQK